MALGTLQIMFIVLVIIAVILQVLLYKNNNLSNNRIVFIINMVFVFILSFVAFTALPINETGGKVVAVFWSLIAVIGLLVKSKTSPMINKIMMTVATLGALGQVLFF